MQLLPPASGNPRKEASFATCKKQGVDFHLDEVERQAHKTVKLAIDSWGEVDDDGDETRVTLSANVFPFEQIL